MRGLGYLIVLIVVCTGIGVVSAVPDSITVSSSEPWLIAIGGQSTTITAHVFNQASPGELYQGEVRFSLETPSMGTLSQLVVVTDASGYASTEFTVSTVRGNAIIRADVTEYPSLYNTTLVPVYSPKPDETSTLTTSSEWIVASGLDHSTITMYARNQSVPIPNLKVTFKANDTTLGKFNPLTAYTDADGKATTTYFAMQRSGTAKINATVDYNIWDSPASAYFEVDQRIDHDTPYRIANYTVTSDVGVGNATVISALIVDRWNNPVDNKRVPENFSFLVSSPTPPAQSSPPNSVPAYWTSNPYSNITTAQTDVDGNVGAGLTVDTRPGMNVVLLHPIGIPVHDKYFFINGVANGQPWYLEQAFEPPELWVFADGEKLFNITYTLRDRYGNGLPNRNITWWTNLPDEQATISTNVSGMARRSYGPKTSIGIITVTAQAEDNLTLIVQENIEFSNMAPTNMTLTASPQSMPSRDVPSSEPAEIIAKVMDNKGNPVDGETVTFTINHGTYPPSQIRSPSLAQALTLSTISAVTNQNGNAIVQFWPGEFSIDDTLELPDYDPQATATCDITATWGSKTDTVTLIWKNYPYLSVYTNVTPKLVNVTDTVDVNIRLVGDGWALQPNPIDVVLLMDRSGSMDRVDVSDGQGHLISRLLATQTSAKQFVGKMNQSSDRIGLVSYDFEIWKSSSNPGVVTNAILSSNFGVINSSIDALNPNNGATATRPGLKQAIDHIIANPKATTKTVQAIVLLTDGNWNNGGSPIAVGRGYAIEDTKRTPTVDNTEGFVNIYEYLEDMDYRWYPGLGGNLTNSGGTYINVINTPSRYYDDGTLRSARVNTTKNNVIYCADGRNTEQNMSIYAKNHGIKIYVISFAQAIPLAEQDVLGNLANSTGGFYQHASNLQQLSDIYAAIAGKLKEEAGVNVTMGLNYENVEINSTIYSGGEVFDYVYNATKSTKEDKYFPNGTHNTGYPLVRNQSSEWTEANGYTLHFNIGNISLYQTWEATYRLRVKKDGNINLFNNESIITFNNGENTLKLPKTFISAIPNMKNESIQNITLDEGEVTTNVTANYTYQWNWTRTYTGTRDVTEKYFVSIDGGQQWIQVGERVIPAAIANIETQGTFRKDLRTVPGAEEAINNNVQIMFRLEAYASDAGEPEIVFSQAPPGSGGNRHYIKLE